MYKKSELYTIFTNSFFKVQQSETNKLRINALDDSSKEIINIAQQAATESTIEIILDMLAELGIIENDCEITRSYRAKAIENYLAHYIDNRSHKD